MIDTAMILAAGRGERMRPLTDTLPKPLVPVAGRSLLDRSLDRLIAHGVRNIVVNVHHLGEQIADRIGDRAQIVHEERLLETGGSVKNALPLLGDGPFFVLNGDGLWREESGTMLERLETQWDRRAHGRVAAAPSHPQGDRPRAEGSWRLFHRTRRSGAPSRHRLAGALCLRQRVGLRCAAVPERARGRLLAAQAVEPGRGKGPAVRPSSTMATGSISARRRRSPKPNGCWHEKRVHHRHRPPFRRRAGGGRAGPAWRRSAGAGRCADPAADAALGARVARGLSARDRRQANPAAAAWRRWATSTKANGRPRRATTAPSPCRPPSTPPNARRCWRGSFRPSRTTRAIPSPSRRRRRSSWRASSAGCSMSLPSRACPSASSKAWSRATSPAIGSARSNSSPSSARHGRRCWPSAARSTRIERRTQAIRAQAARWREHPPATPVIAAGSTGSQPATRDLLAAIAQLRRRARSCCPGSTATWTRRAGKSSINRIRNSACASFSWRWIANATTSPTGRAAGGSARHLLITELMRPAETTEAWSRPPTSSLEHVTRADCATPHQEALVVALALRETLKDEGRTAALVTPDRELARRVAAELRRWNVDIDDSAGAPLADTPPAALLRALVTAVDEGFAPVALLALLKHPLCTLGGDRAPLLDAARRLDRKCLRGLKPTPGMPAIRAHIEKARFGDPADRRAVAALIDQLDAATSDLAAVMAEGATPAALLDATIAAAREDRGGRRAVVGRGRRSAGRRPRPAARGLGRPGRRSPAANGRRCCRPCSSPRSSAPATAAIRAWPSGGRWKPGCSAPIFWCWAG